jgi:hypothetical protein
MSQAARTACAPAGKPAPLGKEQVFEAVGVPDQHGKAVGADLREARGMHASCSTFDG